MLGLGHHAPLPIPAAFLRLLCPIAELAEHSRRFAGLLPLLGRGVHLSPDDLPQPLVTRQPEHEIHAVVLTPTHQLVAAEAGIPA